FEYGLILAHNAFSRWTQRCMAATGQGDLGALDVLVLHSVRHREREKQVSDICFVLGIEDTHLVIYSLKKMERLKLVRRVKRGKETFWNISAAGTKACDGYGVVRQACLSGVLQSLNLGENDLSEIAQMLRALSGLYDQGARAATSL
ncbi:MAG: winged helix DNA-binding protein, partial [Rhodospirillaceae bacterium]|nr:winged helix DNA-binding protein [Rhodospirillaceae bacterium]